MGIRWERIRISGFLRAAVLLVPVCTVMAQEARPIEEVVVQGLERCGSWPIDHREMSTCEFAVLDRGRISTVRELRSKLLSLCLSCTDRVCVRRQLPRDLQEEARLCRRVFWTPTRIRRMSRQSRNTHWLDVSFTYTLSARGRVEDVRLTSLEGEWSREEVRDLVVKGASRALYEPLVVEDVAYEIVDLRGRYVLEE